MVPEVSARIVKAPPETLDREIHHALRDVFQLLRVDRGGLLEVSEDSPVVKVSHAWYAEGIGEVSPEINLADLFPWSYRELVVRGKNVVLASRDELPSEAAVDRRSHEMLGNRSSLTIPLFIGQRVHHLVAVNTQNAERDWPAEVIAQLRLLGDIFVAALERREADQALQRTKNRLDLAAASADAGLWEFNFDSGLIWGTGKARELFGYGAEEPLTLENFLGKVHPDDRHLITSALRRVSSSHPEMDVEYRVPGDAGQIRWMHSRGRLHQPVEADANLLLGVTTEVTRQKELERQNQGHLQEIDRLRAQLEKENAYLRNEIAISREQPKLLGASIGMQAVMASVGQVAGTASTVLIHGETGTGKELVAQTIHRLSRREGRVMVKVNCAALPAALVESELFGREKGAFTGALSRQVGRFELADGSSLFLDEIAEIPLETQAKLLRVLQEGEFERLGSPRTLKVDVRIIAASNRDLAEEVAAGRFRRDLYYRLNVFPIHIPPLRERPEDIPPLVWEFVNEFGERMGKKIGLIAHRDMDLLKAYAWPGNVRELRNVIERALIVSRGDTLELQNLSGTSSATAEPATLEEMERRHIQATLKRTRGRVRGAGGAAELLGLNPSTLYSRMRKLGIPSPRA